MQKKRAIAGLIAVMLFASGCAITLTKVVMLDEKGNPATLSDGTAIEGIEFRSDRFERGTDVTLLTIMACTKNGCSKVSEAMSGSAATIKGVLNQSVAAAFLGAGLGYGLANSGDSISLNQGQNLGPVNTRVGPINQTQTNFKIKGPFGHRHHGDD